MRKRQRLSHKASEPYLLSSHKSSLYNMVDTV